MSAQYRWLLLSFLFLTACSSLSIPTPGPYIQTPMTAGKENAFTFSIGNSQSQRIEVTENAGARPPDTSKPKYYQDSNIFTGFDISMSRRLDLGLLLNTDSNALLMGKLQFMGYPYKERKEGNLSGSVFAATGRGTRSHSGEQKETFGAGGFPYSASAVQTTLGYGVSIGYQWSPDIMPFIGVSRYVHWLRYSISQKPATDNSDNGGTYEGTLKGISDAYGIGVEWAWGAKGIFGVMAQQESRRWEKLEDHNGLKGNVWIKVVN